MRPIEKRYFDVLRELDIDRHSNDFRCARVHSGYKLVPAIHQTPNRDSALGLSWNVTLARLEERSSNSSLFSKLVGFRDSANGDSPAPKICTALMLNQDGKDLVFASDQSLFTGMSTFEINGVTLPPSDLPLFRPVRKDGPLFRRASKSPHIFCRETPPALRRSRVQEWSHPP